MDVGSIEFIHSRVVHERDIGTAVLVVSSELDEVIGLADRIAVMYRGRIIGVVGPDTPREEIGLLMAGITPDATGGSPADGAGPTATTDPDVVATTDADAVSDTGTPATTDRDVPATTDGVVSTEGPGSEDEKDR
ncbi:hypothetical protein GCM10029963_38890 [Micromonospora andamanensis]